MRFTKREDTMKRIHWFVVIGAILIVSDH